MAAAGQLTVNRIPKRLGLAVGCVVLIAGLGLLAAALAARSAALLFFSAAVSGLGEGLPVGFGLGAINEKVGDKRGETDSAYFVLPLLRGRAPGRRGRLRGAGRRHGDRGSPVLRTSSASVCSACSTR